MQGQGLGKLKEVAEVAELQNSHFSFFHHTERKLRASYLKRILTASFYISGVSRAVKITQTLLPQGENFSSE